MVFGFTCEIGLVPNVLLLGIFALAMWDNVHEARTAMKGQPLKSAEAWSGLADRENVAYSVTENSMAPAGGEAVLSAKAISAKAKSKDLVTNNHKSVFRLGKIL